MNLISSNQAMNTSFESFRIVNTYGAFGSITKQRNEVIFKGTHSSNVRDANWLEYEVIFYLGYILTSGQTYMINYMLIIIFIKMKFKCKPGDIERRPCVISPYHYRLDWLMWFAAFQVNKRFFILSCYAEDLSYFFYSKNYELIFNVLFRQKKDFKIKDLQELKATDEFMKTFLSLGQASLTNTTRGCCR